MSEATDAYYASEAITSGCGFDNQRDAFEAGYEQGVRAERARIRAEIDRHREDLWDGQSNGYVWFDDLYDLTAPNQSHDE